MPGSKFPHRAPGVNGRKTTADPSAARQDDSSVGARFRMSRISKCFKMGEAQNSGSDSGLRKLAGGKGFLLVVAHRQLSGDRFEVAEKAACAVVRAGSEIELGAR